MNIQTYLKERLQRSTHYELTDADQQILDKEGIEAYIFKKITSKKFRKWSLDDASQKQIKNAIHLKVSQNKPLHCMFPFGGYKLWSLPTAPFVDWAEFFTIAYYCHWIAPILSVYKYGVTFTFSSDDLVVEKLDNIPKENTDAYFNSFVSLLQAFNNYFPSNFQMEIKRVADLYTQDAFEKELVGHIETMKKAYEHPDPIRHKQMLATSALNIQWKGVTDLSTISEADKQKKIAMGPIIHDAYGKLVKRRAFVRSEENIVVFTTPIPNAIAIGTTKTSVTKFWTGFGVLEQRGEAFADRILSPEQLQQVTKITREEISIDLIDLPNFQKIHVYPELNFSRSKLATR